VVHTNFELTSGSTIGREHRRHFRNNQDSVYMARVEAGTVAIVTDGCGSYSHSEVGAQMGARVICRAICNEVERSSGFLQRFNWDPVHAEVARFLDGVAQGLGGKYSQTVREYLSFTVLGLILAKGRARFFILGDGVFVINGSITSIGPWPNNAPPYYGYRLLTGGASFTPADLEFAIVEDVRQAALDNFVFGSDGLTDLIGAAEKPLPGKPELVGPISQFWENDEFYDPESYEPDGRHALLERRLHLIGRDWPIRNPQPGRLSDDATLVAGRRRR
jgi:hypothetical protein